MTEPTLKSNHAPAEVKALVAALDPWPISNERAWAIVNEHLDGVLMSKRANKMAYFVWKNLGTAALDALHAMVNLVPEEFLENNDEVRHLVDHAFRKENEVCGDASSRRSRETKKPTDSDA